MAIFLPWIDKPCPVLYDTDLLERLSGGRKGVMARMVARDTLVDSLCIVARDEVRLWEPGRKEALFVHERFHRFPLPSHARNHAESLANWFVYQSGLQPEDPKGSLRFGMANGWYSENPALLYAWWRFFALLPDSAVVGWLQSARLDSVQGRLAMESLARCLAGDSLFCPPRSGVPAPTGRPFPVTIPERSLHVLEVRRCPDKLPQGANCQPAAKGRRLARAVVWRW